MTLFTWIRRPFRPRSWVERYQQEVASKMWTRALLAWVESKDSAAHARGPATFIEAVEFAAGLYGVHTVLVTGRTGPLRTPAVAAFGCHSLEVVLTLVRAEEVQPDSDKAAFCFFHFMTAGMPPAEASTFVDETVTAWNRVRGAAEAGDDNVRQWRSNLYTAVSGQLLTGIQDVPNLKATNWKAVLSD
jgi:hypothetical protein